MTLLTNARLIDPESGTDTPGRFGAAARIQRRRCGAKPSGAMQ